MTYEEFNQLFSGIQSIVTSVSILGAGIWAYFRFVRQEENYPNLNFSAEINLVGKQGEQWVVELIAIIENKGKVQHKMKNITFDFNSLRHADAITLEPRWRNQIDFPHKIAEGSFLPNVCKFFFVDPNTTAKYSFVTKLSTEMSFAMLHCKFEYKDSRKYTHIAEKTIQLPHNSA